MSYPDVLGYTLSEGLEILDKANYKYKVINYSSPREAQKVSLDENIKIVRIKQCQDECLELVVCNFK